MPEVSPLRNIVQQQQHLRRTDHAALFHIWAVGGGVFAEGGRRSERARPDKGRRCDRQLKRSRTKSRKGSFRPCSVLLSLCCDSNGYLSPVTIDSSSSWLMGDGSYPSNMYIYTQWCRFLSQEVRENLAFEFRPPRVFALSVWRVSRNS